MHCKDGRDSQKVAGGFEKFQIYPKIRRMVVSLICGKPFGILRY